MEYTPGLVVASQFRGACIDFDIKNRRKVADLTRTLEATAQALVPSAAIRYVPSTIFGWDVRTNIACERRGPTHCVGATGAHGQKYGTDQPVFLFSLQIGQKQVEYSNYGLTYGNSGATSH